MILFHFPSGSLLHKAMALGNFSTVRFIKPGTEIGGFFSIAFPYSGIRSFTLPAGSVVDKLSAGIIWFGPEKFIHKLNIIHAEVGAFSHCLRNSKFLNLFQIVPLYLRTIKGLKMEKFKKGIDEHTNLITILN